MWSKVKTNSTNFSGIKLRYVSMVRIFYVKYTKNVKFLSGCRGPHRPDIPSPSGRKFQFSVHFTKYCTTTKPSPRTSPTNNKPSDLSTPPVGTNHFRTVRHYTFHRYEHCFWNCQGLRPKRKEPQNYLLENQIDILALN